MSVLPGVPTQNWFVIWQKRALPSWTRSRLPGTVR